MGGGRRSSMRAGNHQSQGESKLMADDETTNPSFGTLSETPPRESSLGGQSSADPGFGSEAKSKLAEYRLIDRR
jgi:hypothetical protein